MRKVLRKKIRRQAEKSNGKTIKVFRALWKKHRENKKKH